MTLAWYMVITVVLVLLEVTLAESGLLIPAALGLCFYAAVSRNWVQGMLLGSLAAVSVELLLARERTELLLLPVVALGGVLWRKHGDRRVLLSQVAPGLLLGLAHGVYVGLGENWARGGEGLLVSPLRVTLVAAGSALLGALGLPLALGLADWVAEGLNLERYDRAATPNRRPTEDG